MYFSRRNNPLLAPRSFRAEVSTLLTYAWKTYSRFVIREEGGSLVTWPSDETSKGWGGNVSHTRYRSGYRRRTVFKPVFEYREYSRWKTVPFEIRPFVDRRREQFPPFARIVATFRQWEPRISRLKRFVRIESCNVVQPRRSNKRPTQFSWVFLALSLPLPT